MECIDFKNKIVLTLTARQQGHLAVCPTCRLQWEELAVERSIINQPFDSATEPDIDLADKPLSIEWLTPEFQRMLLDSKRQQGIQQSVQLKKVQSVLASLYPANSSLCDKFSAIAARISSQLPFSSDDFDHRFATVLGYFSEEEASNMSEEELAEKMAEKLEKDGR